MKTRPASTSLRASTRRNGTSKLLCPSPRLICRSPFPIVSSAQNPQRGHRALRFYPHTLRRRNARPFARAASHGTSANCPPLGKGFGPPLGIRRNDWQQQIRFLLAAGIDRVHPGVVVGVVVHVGAAADAVAGLNIKANAVAFSEHHRGWPDLDLDLHDLAGRQIEPPLV